MAPIVFDDVSYEELLDLCHVIWECRIQQFDSDEGNVFLRINGTLITIVPYVTVKVNLRSTAVFCKLMMPSGSMLESEEPIGNAISMYDWLEHIMSAFD